MARVGCIRSGFITGVADTDIICVSDGIDASHQLAFDIARIHPGLPGNIIFMPSGAPEHDIFMDLGHITDIAYKASLHHMAQCGRFNIRIPCGFVITEVGEHRSRAIPLLRSDIIGSTNAILATSGSAPGGDGRHIVPLLKDIVLASLPDMAPSRAAMDDVILEDLIQLTRVIYNIGDGQQHPVLTYITDPANSQAIIVHVLDLISAQNITIGPISQEYRDGSDVSRISLIALIIKGRRGGTASEEVAGIPAVTNILQGLITLEAAHAQPILRFIAAHQHGLPFVAHASWTSRLQGI